MTRQTKIKARLGERQRGRNRRNTEIQKGESMKVNGADMSLCRGEGEREKERGWGKETKRQGMKVKVKTQCEWKRTQRDTERRDRELQRDMKEEKNKKKQMTPSSGTRKQLRFVHK